MTTTRVPNNCQSVARYLSGLRLCLLLAFALTATASFAQITATLVPTESTCQANGTISVSAVSGGDGPYQVALIAGPGVIIPATFYDFDANGIYTFTGVGAGSFTLDVLDANGVEKQFTAVVPGHYEVMNYTVVPALNVCSGGTQTGKITVTGLTGGTPPYRYKLTKPTDTGFLASGGVFDGLTPGVTYEVQVWDACENFQTRQVQLPATATISVSNATLKYLDCNGNVQATYTASGGSGSYTYQVLTGPAGDPAVGSANATGVFTFRPNSSYTVKVTDNCGATVTKSTTLGGLPPLVVNANGSGGMCDASGNMTGGAVTIYLEGGISPYQSVKLQGINGCSYGTTMLTNLQPNGSGFSQTVPNLPRPCSYNVTVTDACGTVLVQPFDQVASGAGTLGFYTAQDCPEADSNNYKFTFAASFGPPYAPSAPFSFTLLNSSGTAVAGFPVSSGDNTQTIALPPGTYRWQIADQCGANTGLRTVSVDTYQPPLVSLDATNQCINAGQVKLLGTNRNPLKPNEGTYSIVSGPDRNGERNNTGLFSNLTSGGAYVFSFDDGCKSVTISITVPPYEQPTFEVGLGALCPPAAVASLQAFNLNPPNVVRPYTYRIIAFNTTGGYSTPAQTDSLFTSLPVGQYNIQGFDACNNSYTYLGKVGALPTPVIQAGQGPYCDGEPFRIRVRQPVYGATYNYYRDGVLLLTTTAIVAKVPAGLGNYSVVVSVGGGCSVTSVAGFSVQLKGNLYVANPTPGCYGTAVDVTAGAVTAGSDAGTLSYFLDAAATQSLANPAAVTVAGTYYIKLVTGPGCQQIRPAVVSFYGPPQPITLTSATSCAGQSVALTADGGSQYNFGSGYTGNNALTVAPTATTMYSVSALDGNGCPTLPAQGSVTVKPLPVLTVLTVACNSLATTFNVSFSATAGATVSADAGTLQGNQVTNVPGSQVLTLTATLNGCSVSRPVSVTNCSASLGNYVFIDGNHSGLQDGGATPFPDVVVTLVTNETVVATTTTNANGIYAFTNLIPGIPYSVSFTTPTGYTATTPLVGGATATDNSKPTGGITAPVTLTGGENNTTLDAGFQLIPVYDVSLSKTVTSSEPYYPGSQVTYQLTVTNNSNVPVYTVAVNDALPPGTAFVSGAGFSGSGPNSVSALVAGPIAAAGGQKTLTVVVSISSSYTAATAVNNAGITGFTATTSVNGPTPTETNPYNNTATVSVPVTPLASVGDLVFEDLNRNGLLDTGEPGVQGITVTLYRNGTVVTTTTTSASGTYAFTDLIPGNGLSYAVGFTTLPATYTFTAVHQGGAANAAIDSDANPATGRTQSFTLAPAEKNLTLDAGIYQLHFDLGLTKSIASVPAPLLPGGLILYRIVVTNKGELTAANTEVTDTPPAGLVFSAANSPGFTSTGSSATASITSLTPGQSTTLSIGYTLVASTSATLANRAEITADSGDDINSTPGNGGTIPSEDDTDTATIQPQQFAALGNFVWDDLNANGQQDSGEPGIVGVTVSLVQNNSIVATTTTETGGLYSFTGLTPGVAYQVDFGQPANYTATAVNTGNDALDSDRNPGTGRTDSYTLASGETNQTVDAGFYKPASLGNFVFFDTNRDGLQTAGETGLGGVLVNLYGPSGQLLTTTTTPDGAYSFTGLMPGVAYQAGFATPTSYSLSPANQGGDDGLDSDADWLTGRTPSVTLSSGENNTSLDAGFQCLPPAVTATVGQLLTCARTSVPIQITTEPATGVSLLTRLPNGFTTTQAVPSVSVPGVYTVTATSNLNGCSNSVTVAVGQDIQAPPASLTSNTPVCEGSPLQLTAGLVSGATYAISGPNGFTATGVAASIATGLPTNAGLYSLTVTNGATGCYAIATTTVTVKPRVAIAPQSGSACEGTTVNIGVGDLGTGSVYGWSGPNSFTSASRVVSLTGVTPASSGTYTLMYTVDGCPNITTYTLLVAPKPAAFATAPGSICVGSTLSLSTTDAGAGVMYNWSGPNNFTAAARQVTIENAAVAGSGTYRVVVTDQQGCTSASSTTVSVKPTVVFAPTTYTICSGNSFTATLPDLGANVAYQTAGPNGYRVSGRFLAFTTLSVLDTGTYSITATQNGCPAESALLLNVSPTPVAAVLTNSPVCAGQGIALTAQTAGPRAMYSWTGPGAFTAVGSTISIPNATSANAGAYGLTVQLGACSSQTAVSITVKPRPDVTAVASASSVCAGSSVSLSAAPAYTGAVYQWTGPNGFTSAAQSVTLSAVQPAAAGLYRVIVRVNGCADTSSVAVQVSPLPGFMLTATESACAGPVSRNDGQIVLTGNQPGDRFDVSPGGTYIGASGYQTARPVPVNGVIVSDIGRTGTVQTYTVRVYAATGCFSDRQVTLQNNDCSCLPPRCVPLTVIKKTVSAGGR